MLQGINNQTDLYSAYNRIQPRRLQEELGATANAQSDKMAQQVEATKKVEEEPKLDLRLDAIKPRTNASLEDVSLSLNEAALSFDMKGRDSDILSLDMDKAVSDMQKDQALMQYQYFVGDNNPFMQSDDGVVVVK